MPKNNREYTGLDRTPPSMAWLLRKRSILKGELDAIDMALEALPRQRVEKAQQLAALDATIQMHEVQVEPSIVRGTRKARPPFSAWLRDSQHPCRPP